MRGHLVMTINPVNDADLGDPEVDVSAMVAEVGVESVGDSASADP